MIRTRHVIALLVTAALVGACSDDSSSSDTTAASTTPTTTVAPTTVPVTTVAPTTVAPTTAVPTTAVPTTVAPTPAVPTTLPVTASPAIWPSADVVFDTPEAAAADFLAAVFGEGPLLGTFRAGDQRSGEIEVFASVDGAPIGDARSTLLLRQLGPADGWFVTAAISGVQTITSPASMATVPAAPLSVDGSGTGFEATIVVSAFVAGQAASELDHEVAMAGNFGETAPFTVSLDLGAAAAGDVVVLLVRGGTGLETDPGDFTAIPVVVA